MKLMKRQRGSTLALPVDQWSDGSSNLYNIVGEYDGFQQRHPSCIWCNAVICKMANVF